MALSILYCRECDMVLAAAPGRDLSVECASHSVGGVLHRGCVALRLPHVDLDASALDLTTLASQYPKGAHISSLEPIGTC